MILHLLFIFLYLTIGSSVDPKTMLYISFVQVGLAAFWELRKNKNFINPYMVNLVALVIINLGNLSLLKRIADGTNYMYFFASADDIPYATVIWCVGNCIFLIGYLLARRVSIFPSVGLKFNPGILKAVFYAQILISLFSKQIARGLFLPNAVGKVLGFSGLIGVLFFARLWASGEDKKYRDYAIVLYLVQTWVALTSSYLRFELILPTIIFYMGYFAGKKSMKSLFSYQIIPFILILVFFLNAFSELGSNRANFGNAIFNYYVNGGDEEDNTDVYDENIDRGGFLDRSATLGQVSAVVRLVNQNGFYNGEVSSPLVAAIIPRFLWPEKPKIAIGQYFAVKVGAGYYASADKANNSVNMTVPGEMYMDFGWWGIAIGCLLFGFFISTLWNSCEFDASNFNFDGTIYGGYILFMALTGISIDLQILINYISFYLVFFIAKKILCAYYV